MSDKDPAVIACKLIADNIGLTPHEVENYIEAFAPLIRQAYADSKTTTTDANGIALALAEVERLCCLAYPCISSNREDSACPHENSWTACFLDAFIKWTKI